MTQNKIIIKMDPDIAEIIPEYLEMRRAELPQIKIVIANKDLKKLQSIVHKIIGTAASYGFSELGRIAEEIEEAAAINDLIKIEKLFSEWEDYLNNVVLEA